MKASFFLLSILLFWGCGHQKQSSQAALSGDSALSAKATDDTIYEAYHSLQDIEVSQNLDTSLFYIIDKVCAVSVSPDTTWFNEQQKSMSEDDWNTVADDHLYYESMAEDSLEAHTIPVLYRMDDKRYLKFVKHNGQQFIIDLLKGKDMWGLILFNGKDNPVFWSDIDITPVLKDFYNK